ncbi:TPA: hypothetical protein KAD15_003064 [Escherichia coli]|nr:hypothetical protein [Escherichia coli]
MKPVFLGQIDISELFSVKDGSQYDCDCLELNGLEYEYRLAIVNDGKKTFSVECFENTYFKQVLRIRQRVEMSIRENIKNKCEFLAIKNEIDAINFVTFTDSGRLAMLELFHLIVSNNSITEALISLSTIVSKERENTGALIVEELGGILEKIKNKELIIEYGKESRKNNLHSAFRSPYVERLNGSASFVNLEFNRFFSSLFTEYGIAIVEVNNENDVPKIIVHSMPDIPFNEIENKLEILDDINIKSMEELIEYLAVDAVAMADNDVFGVGALHEGYLDALELYGTARWFLSGLVDDAPLLINTDYSYSS